MGDGGCAEAHTTKTETKPSTEQAARPTEAPRDRHAATRRAEKTISLRGPILVRWSPSACGLGVLAGWLHTFSYKMISARSMAAATPGSPFGPPTWVRKKGGRETEVSERSEISVG